MKRAEFLALATAAGPWIPTVRPSKTTAEWLQLHQSFVARARTGGIDLLFVGDSLTAMWLTTGVTVWQRAYAPLAAANFGIIGDRTQYLLWRLQNGELDGIAPRAVVLMIGSNNLSAALPADVALGIAANVQAIRERLPRCVILLLGILPRDPDPAAPIRERIRDTNARIAAFAERTTLLFLDMGSAFVQPNGDLVPDLFRDGIHLTSAGYEVWRSLMAPSLAAALA